MRHFRLLSLCMVALIASSCVWSCGGEDGGGGGGGDPTIVSIAVTPSPISIAAGSQQQFAATATMSDGTTSDMTGTVTWSSSDTAVIAFETAESAGLATGIAAGTATVSALDPTSGISSADASGDASVTVAALSGTVSALYPTHGSNWNDYVLNDGANIFQATDTACNPNAGTRYDSCLHGAEMRTVSVAGISSCDGLTASDTLGVFEWSCDDGTSGDVRMVSKGLKEGKGLSDLIDFDAASFKGNGVTVYRGGNPYIATDTSAWYTNPIIEDNDGSNGASMNEGEIYIVTTDPQLSYTIGASKVALLIKPGLTLRGPTASAIVDISEEDFIWVEGALSGSNDSSAGIALYKTRYSAIRNVTIEECTIAGLHMTNCMRNRVMGSVISNNSLNMYIAGSHANLLTDITANDCGSYSMELYGSSDNVIKGFRGANCDHDILYVHEDADGNTFMDVVAMSSVNNSGILVDGCHGNQFINVLSANNPIEGLDLRAVTDTVLINVTASNNASNNIYLAGPGDAPSNNVLLNVTLANSGSEDLFLANGATLNTVMNVLSVNAGGRGIWLANPSSENTIANAAAANASDYAFYLDNSSDNYFTGFIKVGKNDDGAGTEYCSEGGGTNPGLDDETCDPNGASDFGAPVLDITLGNAFVGKVNADSTNADGATGTKNYWDITDWLSFDNAFRAWGLNGSAFPDSDHRGECGAGDTCRIWDWSLASTDAVVRDVLPLPTGDDTLTHTWFDASTTIFLRNAVEIVGDEIGNDDGLCESGETCLSTPNIGSYQGHGNLVSAGAFTNGALNDITLLRYEQNGR